MRHHYWESPIALYLFLGGLGGGILFLSWVLSAFVAGGDISAAIAGPLFIAILCLAAGCFFLVFELGQPPVFWRVFTKAKAIIKWGALLLSIAMFFDLFWLLSVIPWGWLAPANDFFTPFRSFNLAVAGICGFGIMVYTGIMLSTLKAHALWATPALPVLFTVSALSTGCAAISLSVCIWPGVRTFESLLIGLGIRELLHVVDIVLVIAEIVILLIMILSFLGAGNVTAKKIAVRWVKGSYAPFFWIGMIGLGLLVPLALYLTGGIDSIGAGVVAPVLILCGGLLLRYLIVWSDERAPLPGEERFYSRVADNDREFLTAWAGKENLY